MTNRGGGHPIAKTTSSLNGSVIGTSPSAGGTATRTSAGTTAKTSAAAVAAVAADPHTVIGSFSLGTNSKISFFRDAVTNDGKRLYALESAESGFAALPVLVVDLATKQHTSIPLTGTASDMIMAPARPTAYVSELDSTGRIADVAVIDTDQGRVQSRIALPQRGKLTDLGIVGSLAVSADGQYLFVTEPDSVAMVSTSSESVLKYLTVRNGLGSIASSRDGSRVYVVSMYEQSVDVLRTADGSKLAALKFAIFRNGVPAQAALLSPDGKKVYAYGENDGDTTQPDTVGIVDVATNSLRKVNVPSAIGGSTMAISPSGRYLYLDGSYFTAAGELGPNTLNILDLTSFTIRKVPLDGSPYGMAVSRDGKRVYTVVGTNEVAILG